MCLPFVLPPCRSWPDELSPQVKTLPSLVSAAAWWPPQTIWVHSAWSSSVHLSSKVGSWRSLNVIWIGTQIPPLKSTLKESLTEMILESCEVIWYHLSLADHPFQTPKYECWDISFLPHTRTLVSCFPLDVKWEIILLIGPAWINLWVATTVAQETWDRRTITSGQQISSRTQHLCG